jgi:hypothetical protein
MKFRPESLDDAIRLRKQHPDLSLSFSEAEAPDNCILLTALPEIDLCFEDHGQFIFGLNLSLEKMLDYLEDRDAELRDHLLQLAENQTPGTTLGARLFDQDKLVDIFLVLEECNALLKTFNGSSGRMVAFNLLLTENQNIEFVPGELPLLIMIPKDS